MGGFAASLLAASGCSRSPSAEKLPRLFGDSRIAIRDHLSIEVIGDGADVVLVPGLGASRAVWFDLARRLRNRYRLHLVNVAGFGGEAPRSNASGNVILSVAKDIHRYIKSSGLRSPAIIGHSMGGTIALWLTSNFPEEFARVMIVEAFPFAGVMFGGETATVESMGPVARLQAVENWLLYGAEARSDAQHMSSTSSAAAKILEWRMASDHSVVRRSLYEMLMLDLRPKLPQITNSLMLVYSDGSRGADGTPLAPLFQSSYSTIKSAIMVQIANSNHFVMLDQPQKFFDVTERFLSN